MLKNHQDYVKKIGVFLFQIYIVMTFFAQDVLLPSVLGTISLYAFVGWQIFTIMLYGRRLPRKRDYTIWYAGFMVLCLFSMIGSPETGIFTGTYYHLIVNLVLLSLIASLLPGTGALNRIFWTYSLTSGLFVLVLILRGLTADLDHRFGAELFGNQNVFAAMIMFAIVYTFWLLTNEGKGIVKKLILIAVIVLDYYALFLSGGKKYIMIPVIFLYLALLFRSGKPTRKHFFKTTFFFVVVAVFAYILMTRIPLFYNIIGIRLESFLNFLLGKGENYDSSDVVRLNMIRLGLEHWLERPILGHGFDSFKHYNLKMTERYFYYSHNNFVEMLHNHGIVGFAYYYGYYVFLLLRCRRRIGKDRKPNVFIIASVISLLLYEISVVSYFETNVQMWLLFVYLASTGELSKPEKGRNGVI